MFRCGELGQLPIAEALNPWCARDQGRRQGRAAGCSFQRGRQQRRANRNAGGEYFLDQAHPFGEREPAAFAAAPELEVSNQGFE
jgi:hypothetical protein